MNLQEAIKSRHSVRQYTGKPIEACAVAALRSAIEQYNAESGLNIQFVLEEPKAFSGRYVTTYGNFSGVRNYIVMAAPKGRDWEEKIGFYGELVILLAQTLGLNTCWAGLTYRKVPEAYMLRNGDVIHCEISLGYGANQGRQHRNRPMEKFYEADGQIPEWFKAGVEAAMLAPTAVNQQKFKLILHEGNQVEAKPLFSLIGYIYIDLGIAKCHFEIGAGKDNFQWYAPKR